MYIKDIIQSTLDLENYDFYLPEEDFLLEDLTFDEPEPEELSDKITQIIEDNELSLDDFLN
mgnify:CR=1 FL=1